MNDVKSALGIVYILTNAAMPGLVKIGMTDSRDATSRISQIYTTGVPFPFELQFAASVINPAEVERALHTAFLQQRVNPKREFFQIEPHQAIAILKLLHKEDVTSEIQTGPDGAIADNSISQEELSASAQYAARRPNLNFEEMGIPVGATLTFKNGDATVIVSSPKKVKYIDQESSISAITRELLGIKYNVAPGPYWLYNGKSLREIYDETYN